MKKAAARRFKYVRRRVVRRASSWGPGGKVFTFELSCGHVLKFCDPTARDQKAKTLHCDDCKRGICVVHILEEQKDGSYSCTQCTFKCW